MLSRVASSLYWMSRYVERAENTARVLDVASGFGFYVGRWREAGVRDVTASDAVPAALSRVRREHPDTPAVALDITDDAFATGG